MALKINILLLVVVVLRATMASQQDECQLDDFRAFGWWLRHKINHIPVSPILPILQEQLRSFDGHNAQLTSRSLCEPDASEGAPAHSRALCRWHYKVNYDPKRIPYTIAEADCHCEYANLTMTGGRLYKCTPVQYEFRVLKFDQTCNTFVETLESIAMACIPTLVVSAEAHNEPSFFDGAAQAAFETDW